MRLVAAEAGFFPFGRLTSFADILVQWSSMKCENEEMRWEKGRLQHQSKR